MNRFLFFLMFACYCTTSSFANNGVIGLLGNQAPKSQNNLLQEQLEKKPTISEAIDNLAKPLFLQTARDSEFSANISSVQENAAEGATTVAQQQALELLKQLDGEICKNMPAYCMDSAGFAFNTGYMVANNGRPVSHSVKEPWFFLSLPNRLRKANLQQYDRQPGIGTYSFLVGRGWQQPLDNDLSRMSSHRSMVYAVRNLRLSVAYAMLRVVVP